MADSVTGISVLYVNLEIFHMINGKISEGTVLKLADFKSEILIFKIILLGSLVFKTLQSPIEHAKYGRTMQLLTAPNIMMEITTTSVDNLMGTGPGVM